MTTNETRRSGVWWIAAGAALWGTDTVLRRLLTQSLDPAEVVFFEHLLLMPLVLPFILRGRAELRNLTRSDWMSLLAISWVGSVLSTVLFTAAVQGGDPTSAVLLQKLQPVMAILMARVFLGERWPRSYPWLALAAIAGGCLIALDASASIGRASSASLFAVLAAGGWATATILGKRVSRAVSFWTLTSLRIALALPLLLMMALARPIHTPSRGGWVILLVMALVPGLLALILYYRGLRDTPASSATIAELAFPATAASLNWTVLGTTPAMYQLLGFCLVWFAIFLLSRSRTRSAVPARA